MAAAAAASAHDPAAADYLATLEQSVLSSHAKIVFENALEIHRLIDAMRALGPDVLLHFHSHGLDCILMFINALQTVVLPFPMHPPPELPEVPVWPESVPRLATLVAPGLDNQSKWLKLLCDLEQLVHKVTPTCEPHALCSNAGCKEPLWELPMSDDEVDKTPTACRACNNPTPRDLACTMHCGLCPAHKPEPLMPIGSSAARGGPAAQ